MTSHSRFLILLPLALLIGALCPAAAQEADLPTLLRQSHDADTLVRWRALAALQWTHAPAAVERVLAALQDPDARVRKTAARALGWWEERRALDRLIALLHDPDQTVGAAAAEALGFLPDPHAIDALIAARDPDHDGLSDAVDHALERQGPAIIAPLAKLLQDKDSRRRHWAIELIGMQRDPRVLPLLLAGMHDPDKFVRSFAVGALSNQHNKQAVNALIAAYQSEKAIELRCDWLCILSNQLDPRVLPLVIAALHESEMRTAATLILSDWGPDARSPLIAALRDKDDDVRDAAARALSYLKDPRTIPALAAALDTPEDTVSDTLVQFGPRVCDVVFAQVRNPKKRSAALRILAKFHDPRAYAALVNDLHAEHEVDEACTSLGLLGDPRAVPVLLDRLKKPTPEGRKEEIYTLGELRDPRAVPALLAFCTDDASEEIVAAACSALGEIGDPRAIDQLTQLFGSPNSGKRHAAASALMEIKDPRVVPVLARLLKNEEVGAGALYGLRKNGSEAARDVLLEQLRQGDAKRRADVAFYLWSMSDPRVIEALKAALQDPDQTVRRRVARAVIHLAPRDAAPLVLPVITDMLHQPEGFDADLAAEFAQLADPRMTEPLLALLNGQDEQAQILAARGLEALKETQAVPHLISLLETSPSQDVRFRATRALGAIGDPRAVPPLLANLRADMPNGDAILRESAAAALGKLRDPRAVEPLILCLRDPSTRDAAARALGKLRDSRARAPLSALLHATNAVNVPAAGALLALGDTQAIPVLLTGLKDAQDSDRRVEAIHALSPLHDARVTSALLAALRDINPDVRAEAAHALGERKDPATIPALLVTLYDAHPDVRHTAADALATLTSQQFGNDAVKWQAWWSGNIKKRAG